MLHFLPARALPMLRCCLSHLGGPTSARLPAGLRCTPYNGASLMPSHPTPPCLHRCLTASCGSRAPKSCASWRAPRTSWGESSICPAAGTPRPALLFCLLLGWLSLLPSRRCGALGLRCDPCLPPEAVLPLLFPSPPSRPARGLPDCGQPLLPTHTQPLLVCSFPSPFLQPARARPDCGQPGEAAGRSCGAARPLLPHPAQRQERGALCSLFL